MVIKSHLNSRSGKFNIHIYVFNIGGPPPNWSGASEAEKRWIDLKIEKETFPLIHVNVFA